MAPQLRTFLELRPTASGVDWAGKFSSLHGLLNEKAVSSMPASASGQSLRINADRIDEMALVGVRRWEGVRCTTSEGCVDDDDDASRSLINFANSEEILSASGSKVLSPSLWR